ncbi:MAG: vWA domain-containing protein [Opitutaceae bacterium]
MNFESTVWLYLTPVIVLITGGIIAFGLRRREALLGKFAATRLLDQLTEKASNTRTLIKAACIIIALAALGIALARPQYGVEWSERKARGLDIVFVMDSSKSMLATDMRPTRLDRAKLAVIDLIERLESDRIGLVAFAGRAFLQAPPTLDYAAFRESLDAVGPATMTSGGSDIGNALKEAEKAFPKDNNFKVIILLTDGEDLGGNAIATATAAAKNGIKVYSIGIGTPEGEYLRIRNDQGEEEFIRDEQGQPVRSQLDEATLQQIAQLTGGTYSRLSAQSLESLYASVISTLPREEREAELQEKPIERFQWAIATAIILLVLEILIRRRSNIHIQAAIILATTLTFSPQSAEAQDLPLPESIEEEVIEEEVAPLPEDPRIAYNQAYEALTGGDIATATTLYNQSIQKTDDLHLQRDALYNLAHSTYQTARQTYDAGDLEKAIEQIKASEGLFNSVLEIDPIDNSPAEDLQKVEAVRKAMEAIQQQEQDQEQQENQDQEESQDQEQQDQEDQESQDGEDQEGENSQDQQDGEQGEQDQQDGEQSDSQDQESSEQSQDQQQDGEQSDRQDQEGSESDQEGDSQQSEESQSEGSEQQESTGNPAEDMEEQEAQEGQQQQEASDEEQAGEESPQATPGEETEESGEENASQAGSTMVPLEGMSPEDATALLESLRDGEKLLPFIEQGTPQKRGHIKDW